MALFRRDKVPAAIRALQDQLAGGPRVELPPELELLGGLVHTREERAKTKDEPERELLAALPDAAAVVGKDGEVRVANAAFETLAPGGRAAGLSPLEITRSAELDEAVRRGLEGHVRRLHFEAPATRRVWLAHLSPLLRGEVLLLLRDVTETKRGEAMRRDFVANASHELRTPVTAIRGAAETLLAGALADADSARHFVDMVARHAERLARLTQDLLDLSRIESGQWTMELCRVELAGLAQGVLDLHADRAAEKTLRLARDVPEGLAARADPRALEQVLVNLVDNAVKYTPQGGTVTLGAARDEVGVVLTVADTGPGIDRHHLPRLFERFYRADPGRSREQGGTGLGLAIVKHLTQAQEGEVGVESGAGGTRFWVRLPAA
ncbi:MAG: two-component sensor histidine kinase [Anaeromyxobacter sp. RBG_16_69_14]|nr:MAG: two-component sensor histidine kinase [Anaeromyxobacter sp. RBG_16_69_14]